MLDNEFDQMFRDRLLDHPSRIREGLWRQLHTHLVRHNAFWKWYFAGPSAVAAAVAGYLLVTAIHSASPAPSRHSAQAAVVATATSPSSTDTAPTPSPQTPSPAAPSPTSAAPSPVAITAKPPTAKPSTATTAPNPNAAPANAGGALATAATNPHSSATNPTDPARLASTSQPSTATNLSTRGRNHRHNSAPSAPDASNNQDAPDPDQTAIASNPGSSLSGQANAGTSTQAGAHPPVPAQLIAQSKLASLKTHSTIAANNPDPKHPHQLLLPTRKHHKLLHTHIDAFGAPEYFASNVYGLAYGGGIRMTAVYKSHWTLTTGIQYLRMPIPGNTKDSLTPGKVRNYHLPILLGYTEVHDRYTVSAKAGILVSLYGQVKGQFVGSTDWHNRNGTSAYASVDVASRLASKVSVFAEPYFRSWFSRYHAPLPASPVLSTGIMIGFRYDFNPNK